MAGHDDMDEPAPDADARDDGCSTVSTVFPEYGARTQEEMCKHFIPILKESGRVVNKSGTRLARPAKRGEEVLTIINGEVVSKTVVKDDTSMVIRQESADHELYVLDAIKFSANYDSAGMEIKQLDAKFDELYERGYRYYARKGKLLIYQVTQEDMNFVPQGKFLVSFSTIPQPLRCGDYLVTGYPESKEVWMSRHASIYNDDGQLLVGRGARSQAEMREHFIPIMKERGVKLRRAGNRLARPAKKGEEVVTIIDAEVVAKRVVLDDTSMVVQEESADREVYVLDRHKFEENYELPGVDIIEQTPESDLLRSRGWKVYRKTKSMVLMYQATEEDMAFVPTGKFQVSFSVLPQTLKAGDYLVTEYPDCKEVYMSRNAAQIYFSQENLEVHYVFANPLKQARLSIDAELEGLRTSGAVVRLTAASRENLVLLKKAWSNNTASVLHVSCHTGVAPNSEVQVLLEDAFGWENCVSPQAFADLIIGGGPAPQVVVLNSCHSQPIAEACLERGVKRAVAVRDTETLLDKAARDFTFNFYGELRAHRSVETAFRVAIQSMQASHDPRFPREAAKLMLFPADAPEFELEKRPSPIGSSGGAEISLEPNIAVRVPFGAGEAGCIGSLTPRTTQPSFDLPPSRREFVIRALSCFANYRVVKVCGPKGIGKRHFAQQLAHYASFPGNRFFAGGVIIVDRTTETDVVTQDAMCQHFIPILKQKGTMIEKIGRRIARPAKKGEEVQTIINGEVVAKTVAVDDHSMVILQASADKEAYLLNASKFEANYHTPGHPIFEEGFEFDALRERGFMYYRRKGMVLIYRVTEKDMEFIPGGKFETTFSTIPQPVQPGDYLVTGYPEAKEIYMSRNATQIYETLIIRTQEDMRRHFLPILKTEGTVMRRVGRWLGRSAEMGEEVPTIINGEVVAKTVVADTTSMVVQADSPDHEWYVLNEQEFLSAYEQPGLELSGVDHMLEVWRDRGFQCYERRGMVRVYRVRDSDLNSVPGGKFWGPRGHIPQPLRVGDFLLTGYPNSSEVCMIRSTDHGFVPADPAEIVRSQEDMCDHFLPLILTRGRTLKKCGRRAARPARIGEKIRTIIDGDVVGKVDVRDETSMVIRQESADRELYVLCKEKFSQHYKGEGTDITEASPEFDALRERGFKWYERTGTVKVYQVTDEDMEFVPSGQFEVPFSTTPLPLRAGDFLATPCPACDEVYLSRNAVQIYAMESEQPESSVSVGNSLCIERLRPPLQNSRAPSESPDAPPDPGLRAKSELEDAIRTAAAQQSALTSRWYDAGRFVSTRSFQTSAAEAAVQGWLNTVPANSRALLIVMDAAKYFTHDAPRDLLKRLLLTHANLHLLVTVGDRASAEGCPLDDRLKELPRAAEMRPLTDAEAAELFFSAAMRRPQGQVLTRLLGRGTREQAIERLEKLQALRDCQGRPAKILALAERIRDNATSLDNLWGP